jgi:CrcB protein
MGWLLLFTAGGLGAMLRYALSGWVQDRAGDAFPWGTLAVNVVGCFAIGVLATALEERSVLAPELRIALLVGLLGGFTTFSTFGLETWRLLIGGELGPALANALLSVLLCLLAVALGGILARWLA